jgi:hypothetical protein
VAWRHGQAAGDVHRVASQGPFATPFRIFGSAQTGDAKQRARYGNSACRHMLLSCIRSDNCLLPFVAVDVAPQPSDLPSASSVTGAHCR